MNQRTQRPKKLAKKNWHWYLPCSTSGGIFVNLVCGFENGRRIEYIFDCTCLLFGYIFVRSYLYKN